MARIRTWKPEWWSNQKWWAQPKPVRDTYMGLCMRLADDAGRFEADPRIVKGALYSLDDGVTLTQVEEWLQAITRVHVRLTNNVQRIPCLVLYGTERKRLGFLPGFVKHQRISHPTPSVLAPPSRELLARVTIMIPADELPRAGDGSLSLFGDEPAAAPPPLETEEPPQPVMTRASVKIMSLDAATAAAPATRRAILAHAEGRDTFKRWQRAITGHVEDLDMRRDLILQLVRATEKELARVDVEHRVDEAIVVPAMSEYIVAVAASTAQVTTRTWVAFLQRQHREARGTQPKRPTGNGAKPRQTAGEQTYEAGRAALRGKR